MGESKGTPLVISNNLVTDGNGKIVPVEKIKRKTYLKLKSMDFIGKGAYLLFTYGIGYLVDYITNTYFEAKLSAATLATLATVLRKALSIVTKEEIIGNLLDAKLDCNTKKVDGKIKLGSECLTEENEEKSAFIIELIKSWINKNEHISHSNKKDNKAKNTSKPLIIRGMPVVKSDGVTYVSAGQIKRSTYLKLKSMDFLGKGADLLFTYGIASLLDLIIPAFSGVKLSIVAVATLATVLRKGLTVASKNTFSKMISKILDTKLDSENKKSDKKIRISDKDLKGKDEKDFLDVIKIVKERVSGMQKKAFDNAVAMAPMIGFMH